MSHSLNYLSIHLAQAQVEVRFEPKRLTGKYSVNCKVESFVELVLSRVHNIYMERECPTLHMLCTNTLRKLMMQQPLTAKVLTKLKPYATLKF